MDKLAASLFAPSTAPYFASFRPLCDKSLCCDEVNLPSFLSSSSSYHLPISEQRSTTPRTSPKARRKKRTPSLTREESEECPPFDCCCSMNGIVPVVPPPDCEECVHHCEEACAVKLTPQCTDQCVVVACNDPHPIASSGPDSALDPPCDLLCTDVTDCSGLDEWFCCSEYHPPFPTDRSFSDSNDIHNSSFSWDPNLDPMLANANPSGFQGHSQFMNSMFHPGNSTSHAPEFPHTSNSFLPTSDSFNSPSAASAQTSSYGSSSVSTPMVSSTLSPEQQNPLQCMWGNCGVIFSNMSELVGHVNLQHLRIPSSGGAGKPQNRAHGDPFTPSDQQKTISDTLACLWADCHLYPTPNSVPGPSTGNPVNNALGVLASHLLQDHLGLAASPSPSTPPLWEPQPLSQSQGTLATPPESTSSSTLSVSGPPTPTPEHDCSAPNAHVCGWVGCGQSFPSCDDLTAHINAAHVGGGKAHYDCHWTGCGRNGENGFSSKQKICRHLQSHTGHRPFQCKTCKQNFSEAATLAQHMRRHTQEKPYVCDFPGCGKSFAITGALTIHKRTHNGQKPFKCTYCDRAFAESSNLSKHLRTHTGARPYPCTHPGCTKCFARPDQLGRHMSVHRKKITIIPSDGGSGSMNASRARAHAHTQEVVAVAGVGGSVN